MIVKKRITHKDVARAAGVSTAVVSYVINNGPRPTSTEVRERVLQAIRDLDYHPNAIARGLRARRTNTIGYIVNDYFAMDVFTSSYSAHILTGLIAQLKEHQYYAVVYPLVIGEDLRPLETLLRSERLDGVVVRLVQDAPESDSLLDMISSTNLPCICIERPGSPQFGFPVVTYDDHQGAYMATRYLLEKGHTRIGHISGDLRYSSARARRAGYLEALADAGIAADESLIQGGNDWDTEVAVASMGVFLAQAAPPTAVFAANDSFALRAVDVVQAHNLRVPDDVAIIGFDNIPEAQYAKLPLTTISIPLYEMGQHAANLMLDILHSGDDATFQTDLLPVQLIERATA